MIDDYSKVNELMTEMQEHLPIPAYPTSQLVRLLRSQGLKASTERPLFIKQVFYLGNEGGISCDVTPTQDAKTHFVISLTHLRIPSSHSLFRKIQAYQKERVKRIAKAA